jgi:8-oxo-dGTP pyrophosphatase MutT (NUDIX family)
MCQFSVTSQGGIDEGETAAEAAVRELREETGVTSAEIIGQITRWVTYDFPPEVRARLREHWGKDWKGQAQKW